MVDLTSIHNVAHNRNPPKSHFVGSAFSNRFGPGHGLLYNQSKLLLTKSSHPYPLKRTLT